MNMTTSPVIREPRHVPLVHLIRAGLVEGTHYGSVVVLAADGSVAFASGDVDAAFYPRSTMKPVQAVGMLRAGLALEGALLALSASSHSGEEFHLKGARRILDSAGLDESDLRNTADLPYGPEVREQWIVEGRPASQLAQNCSGKHAAMLRTARRRGWPTEGYTDPDHPLQREIATTVEELTGAQIARVAVDGCGAPLFAVSLLGLTRAIAAIGRAAPDTPEGAVAQAFRDHPEMVGGTGRDVTRMMRLVPGLIAKDGFEAVQVAALPDGRAIGVKIADGSDRARIPVTAAALAWCGIEQPVLAEYAGDLAPAVEGLRVAGELAVTSPGSGS